MKKEKLLERTTLTNKNRKKRLVKFKNKTQKEEIFRCNKKTLKNFKKIKKYKYKTLKYWNMTLQNKTLNKEKQKI